MPVFQDDPHDDSRQVSPKQIKEQGGKIAVEVAQLGVAVSPILEEIAGLVSELGSDDVATVFRKGADGRKGIEQALYDIVDGVSAIEEAYGTIGSDVSRMGDNVGEAEWTNAENGRALQILLQNKRRADQDGSEVFTPETEVRLTNHLPPTDADT